MKKLNKVMYGKLYLQAEEAKVQDLTKLASGIFNAIGPTPEDEQITYDYAQLQEDVYQGMWKIATDVLKYHNLESADAEKIHEKLESLASHFVEELESALDVANETVGPLETKLPGESE